MKCLLSSYSLIFLLLLLHVCDAQFGIAKNRGTETDEQQPAALVDLNDPELEAAMEIFASMSPEEMAETAMELRDMMGDDPELLRAVDEVLSQIPKMETGDVKRSLEDMVADDEIATATNDALRMLQRGDGAWETIWTQRDLILESVIQSGQISEADAVRFRADSEAWENELKFIWSELKKQAAATATTAETAEL